MPKFVEGAPKLDHDVHFALTREVENAAQRVQIAAMAFHHIPAQLLHSKIAYEMLTRARELTDARKELMDAHSRLDNFESSIISNL
jgi:hypothetical protein